MFGKCCQSCGMPLSKDIQGGGTEKNGAKSTLYCSHCYQDGEFTLPHITVDEMKSRVQQKMQEKGFPKFIAKFFSGCVTKLQRWQKKFGEI